MLARRGFTVTVLIVGFLIVGFGLIAIFQVDDTYGHTGKFPPGQDVYKSTAYKLVSMGPRVRFSAYCSQCGTSRGGYTRRIVDDVYDRYTHYHLDWKLNWVRQYDFDVYIKRRHRTVKIWDPCTNSQCPSNQN